MNTSLGWAGRGGKLAPVPLFDRPFVRPSLCSAVPLFGRPFVRPSLCSAARTCCSGIPLFSMTHLSGILLFSMTHLSGILLFGAESIIIHYLRSLLMAHPSKFYISLNFLKSFVFV